jgi:beta-lactamase regulating signal transducer with metallopeptidase domain
MKCINWNKATKLQNRDTFFKRWLLVMATLLSLVTLICLVFVIPIVIIQYTHYQWIGGVWFFVAISGVVAALTD